MAEKLFLEAMKGRVGPRPPIWLMRQAGRYLAEYRETRAKSENFLEFCYTPELAIEVTLQPLRRYDFDAAIMFCDILVIPDALGQSVAFKTGEGPVLEPIRDAKGLQKLSMEGLHEHMAPVYQTLKGLSESIPDHTALIGFAGAPWTIAVYMVEGRGGTDCGTARQWAYAEPEVFGQLMDIIIDATATYLIAQINAGAETVQLFDSWASVLSEDQFRTLVIEPNRRVIEKVRAVHPDVPIIGFPRGAGRLYEEFIKATGVNAVGVDHTVPVATMKNDLQPLATVQGNLDNHLLVAGGPALDAAVDRLLEELSSGPFIFNLGHGILPPTPPENVARVVDKVKAFG
ncbi:MAG: uroporphyrinogen decarboxylase [Magnetovibrionaceae bacterium]